MAEKWSWGEDCKNVAPRDIPADHIMMRDHGQGTYLAAVVKGRQKNGAMVTSYAQAKQLIHIWQIIFGYGPVYSRETDGTYYKIDVYLIGVDEELLSPQHPATVYYHEPECLTP